MTENVVPLVDVEFDLGFLRNRIVETDRTEFFLVGSLVGSSGSGATGLPRPEFDPRCPESADFVDRDSGVAQLKVALSTCSKLYTTSLGRLGNCVGSQQSPRSKI